MANYTYLYSEYIADGGQIPAAFSLIPPLNGVNFGDLFYEHYCASEIGFEITELFAVKFNARADIVCPAYAEKITAVNTITLNGNSSTLEKIYTNPTGAGDSVPQGALTGSVTRSAVGVDTLNAVDARKKIIDEKTIYHSLLDEFKTLFMAVYL